MPDYFGMLGGAIGIGYNTMNSIIGNEIAYDYASKYAGLNYEYNEKAAENAKNRQIELYNMLASPKALREQYKEAGLSPSLMFGGGGPGGQASAAPMGAGASGIGNNAFGVDSMQLAQIDLMQAQAEKARSEADINNANNEVGKAKLESILAETENKRLKSIGQQLQNTLQSIENEIAEYTKNNKIELSDWEVMQACKDYELMCENLRQEVVKSRITEETCNEVITETKQKVIEQAARIGLLRAQKKLAESNIHLNNEQINKWAKDISLHEQEITIGWAGIDLSYERLGAQVEQWAIENKLATSENAQNWAKVVIQAINTALRAQGK